MAMSRSRGLTSVFSTVSPSGSFSFEKSPGLRRGSFFGVLWPGLFREFQLQPRDLEALDAPAVFGFGVGLMIVAPAEQIVDAGGIGASLLPVQGILERPDAAGGGGRQDFDFRRMAVMNGH